MKEYANNKYRVGLQELELTEIKADGWLKAYLNTMIEGQTGNMDKVGGPFAQKWWGNFTARSIQDQNDVFVGGMQVTNVDWVPFEQTGYWIDGMIRCGYLTDNLEMTEKGKKYVYDVVEQQDEDGYLGPDFLKDDTIWAHTVFFRAMVAEYKASHDERILEALKKHFLRAPLKDVYKKYYVGSISPMIGMRNITDVEIALWIYGETGDERFLQMAEESYEAYNEKYFDDWNFKHECKSKDVTLPGMMRTQEVCNNHGVTYDEACKIPAILYQYTGKEIYKQGAINAFDKLYRDQMIIDGVHSSTEYLNGHDTSLACHETCCVSDFTWSIGYLYMITKDSKYGDWIEDAIFNAGLGSCDDDFKGNQYFSCPNQVIADDTSNHNLFFRGSDWMSFSPKEFLCCCAGNVHRFMPNYVLRAWMKEDDDKVFATMYGPSVLNTEVSGKQVQIREITDYPFENQVKFVVESKEAVEFSLYLRNPGWSKKTSVKVNGEELNIKAKKGFFVLQRTFAPQDTVEIEFTPEVKLIENAKGISVKYGALLYALRIEEKVVVEGLRELGNPDFPHYSLYADSQWNYGLDMSKLKEITVIEKEHGSEPWRKGCGGTELEVPVREVKNWKLRNVENGRKHRFARDHIMVPIGYPCKLTPVVSENVKEQHKGEAERIRLVPYCTTRLRIAIFPKV